MSYGGYDQGYGGNQGYSGGFGCNMQDYTYQQQQTMPYQAHGGYNPYGQLDVYPPQQMSGVANNAYGAYQYNGYTQPSGDDAHSTALKSSKSFTGPSADVEHKQSSVTRSRSIASRSSKSGGTGMARHGSIFFGTRERDTQVAISTRGGMSVRGLDEEESEELKQFYGDMACRSEERRMDGLKAVRSYRGDIEEGEDVGKPRRVTNRRNVDGRSATGYGGINFKRKAAMRNGEQWGEVEIRSKSNGNGVRSRSMEKPFVQQPIAGPSMYMTPVVLDEAPVVPQIYNREDVHSYGNISDSFSEADEAAARDFEY